MSIQELIGQANKRTAASRKQAFAKRATAEKVHENLLKCVDIYIESLRQDPAGSNTRAALQEMLQAATLSRRSLQP